MNAARPLAVLAAVAAAACAPEASLDLEPVGRVAAGDAEGVVVSVAEPVDRRPAFEVEGAQPEVEERRLFYVYNASRTRGSEVTGDAAFARPPLEAVRDSLVRYLRTIDGVSEAGAGAADADYTVEVEVLHLSASSFAYEDRAQVLPVVPIPIDLPGVERRYVPHATVTLRVRMTDARGRPLAERVVSSPVLGRPEDPEALGDLAAGAQEGALHRARGLVASWIAADLAAATTSEEARARLQAAHAEGHGFWVHAVRADRAGVTFMKLSCPEGAVLESRDVDGVPPVGPPGVWHVSPMDPGGVAYPPVVYDALTRHLARHFALARAEQIATYRYLGRR